MYSCFIFTYIQYLEKEIAEIQNRDRGIAILWSKTNELQALARLAQECNKWWEIGHFRSQSAINRKDDK